MDVTNLTYTYSGGGGSVYIDLTKGLTMANNRAHDQFKNDKPLGYLVTARLSDVSNGVETIPHGWVQKNALVKTAAAWRAMLKKAKIRKSDLNTYGKELRLAYDATHSSNWGINGSEQTPDGIPSNYASGEFNSDGDEITVAVLADASGVAAYGDKIVHAFDHTQMTLPSASAGTDAGVWKGHVIGQEASGVIKQYVDSRLGSVEVEDTDMDGSPALSGTNYLSLMLSDNEETSDDVVDDVKDYGDFRPYSIANHRRYETMAIAPNANVAGQDTSFIAPLGLMKWTGGSGDKLFITVQAITEM